MYRDVGIIKSGGIELRGMKASLAPRRQQSQSPKLEKYQFIPFESSQFCKEDDEKIRSQILTVLGQIVLENSSGALKLKIVEVAYGKTSESLIVTKLQNIFELEPMLTIDVSVIISGSFDSASLETVGIKAVQKDVTTQMVDQNVHLVVLSDILVHGNIAILSNSVSALKPGGFILLEEPKGGVENKLPNSDLEVVAQYSTSTKTYVLLRKSVDTDDAIIITITENHFKWVETLKDALKLSENEGRKVILVTEREELTGLIGLVNCVMREPGGANIRSFFLKDSKAEKFSLTSSFYQQQLKKDLIHNVLKGGVWGSFRHLPLDQVTDSEKLQVEHAYINTLVRGDLSSLKWIEGPLTYYRYI